MINRLSKLTLTETVEWIQKKNGGVVLCCTLNEIMMASEDREFAKEMTKADLLTPDGMPLVWYLRWKHKQSERVYGPDIMRMILKEKGCKIYFIGDHNNKNFFRHYGEYLALPYKDSFTDIDYRDIASKLNLSKAHIVWIGLGAKKQVLMATNLRSRCPNKVFVTVGAAFDFLSNNKKQAPVLLRKIGLEWLFRLLAEPKRLTKRYLKIVIFLIMKLLGSR